MLRLQTLRVESYKKSGPKVALRVSVETLRIAWLCSAELQRTSQLGREGWVANRIASNRIKRSDKAEDLPPHVESYKRADSKVARLRSLRYLLFISEV